jgi:hypothetical protein
MQCSRHIIIIIIIKAAAAATAATAEQFIHYVAVCLQNIEASGDLHHQVTFVAASQL